MSRRIAAIASTGHRRHLTATSPPRCADDDLEAGVSFRLPSPDCDQRCSQAAIECRGSNMTERPHKPRARRRLPKRIAAAAADEREAEVLARLGEIRHIVVLMLENRSFDHLLGYVSLDGGRPDVDGLADGMANEYAGSSYPAFHLVDTVFAEDPLHDAASVSDQLADHNGGFVRSFAAVLPGDPGKVMGYYNAD